jgi:hypothetical protein
MKDMIQTRFVRLSALALFAIASLWNIEKPAFAQQTEHAAPAVASTQLVIKTYNGKALTLSPEELAAMPHKSVAVFNAHSKANETYSGVPLADLLSKAGVPFGEAVRGKLFMIGIVASGSDGYGVLYSLAEVDPAIHTGDVIVADKLDGEKLGKDGVFKMVSSEERRPARWVRNLASISVVKVEP